MDGWMDEWILVQGAYCDSLNSWQAGEITICLWESEMPKGPPQTAKVIVKGSTQSLCFSTACIFRYNALSLVYLLYLLLLPWFQWPNKHTLRGKSVSHAFAFSGAILSD